MKARNENNLYKDHDFEAGSRKNEQAKINN